MSPADTLRQLINSQVISRLIYVVAKLGIADFLKNGPMSCEQLAKSVNVNSSSLYRALRTLASVGVFSETEAGIFKQTKMSKLLESDIAGSQRAVAMLVWEPWWRQGWDELLYSVETGKVGFDHVHGMGLFEYLSRNADASSLFNKAMDSFTGQEIDSILSSYDFSNFTKIVDIGGGNGAFMCAILKSCPDVNGILFDLPNTIATARKLMKENAEEKRCDLIAGDFFKSMPVGGDLYTLKSVIHDWDDERAIDLLKNCHKAMAGDGRLLLIERVIPSGDVPSAGKIMDIVMMVNLGGLERNANEYEALLNESGFRLTGIIPTGSAMSIIECVPD
ncbi:multifunctional cyclase-dehydratase-3-O-methyl transferase TcmN [bacterium BMS3Bbin06]|nr:multifunctional cyclase-dehydratase-3-O-methyl transferase TcmN [bacterium BMS3Abin08]GBE34813.1 multifunctional cyclase-dehydratase-3-O-methyl transferase TcmN [bacterium BMS3Bbin06]HDY70986.1 methyltransferase [Nitrospirota bacterium]